MTAAKNRSPQQVRRVVTSLIEVMHEHNLETLDKPFLEAIIRRCDKELGR